VLRNLDINLDKARNEILRELDPNFNSEAEDEEEEEEEASQQYVTVYANALRSVTYCSCRSAPLTISLLIVVSR